MVGQRASKQCHLLIELEQYNSLGVDPADIEAMKQKAGAFTRLVQRAKQEFDENEKEMLATVNLQEEQIRVSEECYDI